MSPTTEVEGVVVHIRKSSKKLVFLDICRDEERITVLFKSWETESIVEAVKGDRKIHVGDKVLFKGYFESEGGMFSVREYAILTLWSDTNPGESFVPQPPQKLDGDCSQLPCKEFVNTGQCCKSQCSFLHTEDRAELIQSRVKYVQDKKVRQILVHENNFEMEAVSSSQRARIFAEWIVEKFGLGRLLLKMDNIVWTHLVSGNLYIITDFQTTSKLWQKICDPACCSTLPGAGGTSPSSSASSSVSAASSSTPGRRSSGGGSSS